MKKFFNSIKNATKNLLWKSEDATQVTQNEVLEQKQEEQKQQFEDNIIDYLHKNKDLKNQIQNNPNYFTQLLVDLCWKKIMDLKLMYANERRACFSPKLIFLEEQHQERIIIQIADLVLNFFKLTLFYDKNKIIFNIKQRILEEQCTRILFSKDEFMDYFTYIQDNYSLLITELYQQFPSIKYEYSIYTQKEIKTIYIIDKAYDKFNIDDCDEYKAVQLFSNDPEVIKCFKNKQNKIN